MGDFGVKFSVIVETYSLLEDWGIRICNCLTDFLIGGVWAHNAVLALSSSL